LATPCVHINEAVGRCRDEGEWEQAWILVTAGIMAAHHGDRHAHQRKASQREQEAKEEQHQKQREI
jgi:hypothetical protein